jgi:hypothetical protein
VESLTKANSGALRINLRVQEGIQVFKWKVDTGKGEVMNFFKYGGFGTRRTRGHAVNASIMMNESGVFFRERERGTEITSNRGFKYYGPCSMF